MFLPCLQTQWIMREHNKKKSHMNILPAWAWGGNEVKPE